MVTAIDCGEVVVLSSQQLGLNIQLPINNVLDGFR